MDNKSGGFAKENHENMVQGCCGIGLLHPTLGLGGKIAKDENVVVTIREPVRIGPLSLDEAREVVGSLDGAPVTMVIDVDEMRIVWSWGV